MSNNSQNQDSNHQQYNTSPKPEPFPKPEPSPKPEPIKFEKTVRRRNDSADS